MISPEGKSISYSYDKTNRLSQITNGGTVTFGYDARGQRTGLTYPNGDTAAYSYDKQGRLTSLTHKNGNGIVIRSNSYTLDKIGNRQTNTTQDRTSSYSYDPVYRLIQALTNTPGNSSNTKPSKGTTNATEQQKEFFSYDPVGNRMASANNKTYAYGPANQLTTVNGTTYSYDKNGNLTQKTTSTETTTYTWDFENKLIKVTTPVTTSEYAYDPFGRRIEKKTTENGTTNTTKYFYDKQSILFDYDETGTIGNRYIHGPNIDEPLAVTIDKDKYYYHADGLGSIISLTDQSGKTVQTYVYDSFGDLKDQKNRIKQPYAYTGREWDKETGLYYYRARYYDPIDGRFISKDPIGFAGGINLFNYTDSNPINRTDPLGLTWSSNGSFLSGWMTGGGSNNRFYGPNTIETQEMRNSPGGAALRNAFFSGGCRNVNRFSYGSGQAAWDTLINPSTADWAGTGAQVGGFAGASATTNGNRTVTFTIPNVAGAHSFFYHIVPDRSGSTGAMSNINQTFQWTETIDANACGCNR